ncbi:SDR family oxidoreductase [Sphingomonas sp. So64.6b]|uniref:SDR family oxidoreductase n=1 Tax=Sphingomonas sp. So64.6b TaxID=2997354 RepID=UPI0016024F86|nr:SDR family oxidoreductase [Sphingomonas sp. So64.6b]QNA85217.1 SDR family oxidoreductase [Sphingomonas sp. So64.6b]
MIASHIVILGGTSGIGLATAELAIANQARVTVIGRDPAKLDAAIGALGPRAQGEAVDATDHDAITALFARIAPFDHLVIAASGGAGAGSFPAIDPEGLRRGFEAKFWVQWHAARAALPHLATDGSITFITAASSRLANPGTSGLAAINGAIERMVPTLARELAPLRVNAVSPGVIETGWWADKPAAMFDTQAGKAPLGRAGQPAEVASAIHFLISNRFVTGVVLDVDGGLHLT